MMRCTDILLFSLITLCSTVFAQDVNRVDELNNQAREFLKSSSSLNIEQARDYATQALMMAVQIGYHKGEADACNTMADIFEIEGKPSQALKMHKRAQHKLANPDAQSTAANQQQQPKQLGDFPSPVETRPTPRQQEPEVPHERPDEVRKPMVQPVPPPCFVLRGA